MRKRTVDSRQRKLNSASVVVAISGLSLGLFANEALAKIGRESVAALIFLPLTGAVGVYAFWRIYSGIIVQALKAEKDAVSRADALSYLPLCITLLMFARGFWPVPRLGAVLLVSAVLMTIWIKSGQSISFSKGGSGFGKWTYAVPLGFTAALVSQIPFETFNVARYLIFGQAGALVIALLIFLSARFITLRKT